MMSADRRTGPKAKESSQVFEKRKAPGGLEPPIEILQTSALPLGDGAPQTSVNRKNGAGEGVRTLDFNLGKVALYH
jgi:hypothetical protein